MFIKILAAAAILTTGSCLICSTAQAADGSAKRLDESYYFDEVSPAPVISYRREGHVIFIDSTRPSYSTIESPRHRFTRRPAVKIPYWRYPNATNPLYPAYPHCH